MLGNDVVDLLDVDARPETFHRRFDARVFSADERERIARDDRAGANPRALRWAHWAAKEAAYKLMRQRDPSFVFSPIRLVARFDEPGTGTLPGSTRRGRLELAAEGVASSVALELTSFETNDYVHVLALPAGGDWQAVASAVEPLAELLVDPLVGGGGDPSRAVRRLAQREIARALGVDPARLAIGRRDRIPTLELDGRTLSIALSLSHHGRFVAYAMAPRPRGLRIVRAGHAEGAVGPGEAGTGRGETVDGEGAQAAGAVGCPARAADAERKTG